MKLHRITDVARAGGLVLAALVIGAQAFGGTGVLAAASAARTQDAARGPLRYGRVARSAELVNLASRDGVRVDELLPGTLVAVYEESSGFLGVEVPGGFGVWVYGQYLRATDAPGVYEITANNVNVRPSPSSEINSFPLAHKLSRGERVRAITRLSPGGELAVDWVRIWSPPGVYAWLEQAAVEPLASGEDGRGLWKAAVETAQAARPLPPPEPAAARASAPAADASAPAAAKGGAGKSEAMLAAEALLAEIKSGASSDFEGARAAYRRVIEIDPQSAEAGVAQTRLEELDARAEVARLKQDLSDYEERRSAELARAQADLAELERKKDPLAGGRFQARGWLEREARERGEEVFVIRWSGQDVAEAVCTDGRYELGLFEGYEIGASGVQTRAAITADIGRRARPPRLDIARIEVISGRPRR